MALLNCSDQLALADWADVLPVLAHAFAVFVLWRLAITDRQVSDDVLVAFERAVLVAGVEELARATRDDADIRGAELVSIPVSRSLFDGLVELGIANTVFLALNDGIW